MTRAGYIMFGQWRYYHSPTELHLAVHFIGFGCSVPWILGGTAYNIEYPYASMVIGELWLGIICCLFSVGGMAVAFIEGAKVCVPLWRAFFALCNACAVLLMASEGISSSLPPTLSGGQVAWEICNIYLFVRSLLDANALYEKKQVEHGP